MLLRSTNQGATRRSSTSEVQPRRVKLLAKGATWHHSVALELEQAKQALCESPDVLSLGELPTPTQQVKADHVKKLCAEEWQKRFLVLTEEELMIAQPESNEISDKIPLHEIRHVSKTEQDISDDMLSDYERVHSFNVHTVEDGYNCGRTYCFRVTSDTELNNWVSVLLHHAKRRARKVANQTLLELYRTRARKLTSSRAWQRTNALIVALNFVVNISQSQTVSITGEDAAFAFNALDITFTSIFAFELVLHIFAYWFRPFFSDGWLVFDLIVISISIASLIFQDLPGVSILRLLRTFRVLRLFHRLRSLRTLINSLASSIVPVFHAFLMVLLVSAVFAILGVELFSERSPETFGSFTRSYWTSERAMSSMNLSLLYFYGLYRWTATANELSMASQDVVDPVVACFMCSFITVVAVLLDNFIRAVAHEKLKAYQETLDAEMRRKGVSKANIDSPLEPLLQILSRFKNPDDFSNRLRILFKVLDVDMGGTLDFREMQEGMKKMDRLDPRVHISSDDFQRITKHGKFCDQRGHIDFSNFEKMFRVELEKHVQSMLARAYDESLMHDTSESSAVLASLKLLLMKDELKVNDQEEVISQTEKLKTAHEEQVLQEIRFLRMEMHQTHMDVLKIQKELEKGRNGPPTGLDGSQSGEMLPNGCDLPSTDRSNVEIGDLKTHPTNGVPYIERHGQLSPHKEVSADLTMIDRKPDGFQELQLKEPLCDSRGETMIPKAMSNAGLEPFNSTLSDCEPLRGGDARRLCLVGGDAAETAKSSPQRFEIGENRRLDFSVRSIVFASNKSEHVTDEGATSCDVSYDEKSVRDSNWLESHVPLGVDTPCGIRQDSTSVGNNLGIDEQEFNASPCKVGMAVDVELCSVSGYFVNPLIQSSLAQASQGPGYEHQKSAVFLDYDDATVESNHPELFDVSLLMQEKWPKTGGDVSKESSFPTSSPEANGLSIVYESA